jgi:hypothetical protein
MNANIKVLASFGLIMLGTASTACTLPIDEVDDFDDEVGEVSQEVMITAPDQYWRLGDDVRSETWDSDKTKNLSDWTGAFCTNTYGHRWVLNQVKVAREPSFKSDNWVAKVQAFCQEYRFYNQHSPYAPEEGRNRIVDVYSHNHRTPDYYTGLYIDGYVDLEGNVPHAGHDGVLPTGVSLTANTHVKNMQFQFGPASNSGDWAIPENGYLPDWRYVGSHGGYYPDLRTLQCDSGWYVVGLSLRHNTTNGKIRKLRIYCRELVAEEN